MTAILRPPFAYYGGRTRLAATIADMLPDHTHYDIDLYSNWYRYELPAYTTQGEKNGRRTEILWSNRPLHPPHPAQSTEPSLFDAYTSAGNETPHDTTLCNETRCQVCHAVITQPGTGRPRRFCSTACRVAHHRKLSPPPAILQPDAEGPHEMIPKTVDGYQALRPHTEQR